MISVDRINGVSGDLAIKTPVRVATTANITLSGLQTIDGVALAADDRVLVKNQTTAASNGIWIANTSAWSRALDFDGRFDVVQGTMVPVVLGTVNAGSAFKLDTAAPVIGTSSLSFSVANDFALRADLASTASGKGTDLIGYPDPVAPAYLKTLSSIINGDEVSIFRFLSAAQQADVLARTLTLDLTADLSAAHATGVLIRYQRGAYKFSTLTIANGGIIGGGRNVVLHSTNAGSEDLITCTSNGGAGVNFVTPRFSGFHIETLNTKAAGAALRLAPAGGVELEHAYIDRISTYNVPRGVHLTSCVYGSVSNCAFQNWSDAGVYYEDLVTPGAGDSSIVNCTFTNGLATGNRAGIYQASGGGLRIVGNKILGGKTGIAVQYAGATGSGPMVISGNSIENQEDFGIFLASAVQEFGGIVITGNEIGQVPNCIATDSAGHLTDLTISGNYLQITAASTTGKAVALNGVNGFVIDGNQITGNANSTIGVDITATCSNGKVGTNRYKNLGSGSSKTVNNLSTTTQVATDSQAGNVNALAHNTAFGSLFHGSTAVTFPVAFTVTPEVSCIAGGSPGVAGGFSCYATDITKTGFTMHIVAISAGSTNSNRWEARGVI